MAHCENCGRPDPVAPDGYTECCNEPVCSGGFPQTWATGTMEPRQQTGTVRACCAAVAATLVPAGIDVLHREA